MMCTYEQLAEQCAMHKVTDLAVFNHADLATPKKVSVVLERGDDTMRVLAHTPSEAFEIAHNALCADLGWYTPYEAGLDGKPMQPFWSDAGKEEWRRGDHDRVTRDREAS